MRRSFDEQAFLEVDTPALLRAPAPERFIEAPAVSLSGPAPGEWQRRFLQTSPELSMKQLLADGHERLYQIAPCFRDGDWGPSHCPEFRLLEWYRAHADWQAGMDDCRTILVAAGQALADVAGLDALPAWLVELIEGAPIKRVRMDEAFLRLAHIDLSQARSTAQLQAALRAQGIFHDDKDGYDELCHRVLVGCVEPTLLADARPVFLTHFPLPLASWASPCLSEPHLAERFELYAAGRELANGFTELLDASALAQRFAIEHNERRVRGMHAYAQADAFFARLPQMPPSVGIAMGFERLLMAVLQQDDIDAVQFVPFALV